MRLLKDPVLDTVYLYPGEICITKRSKRVITVLGSCVSVTMFNPRLRVGAICHGTLPSCRTGEECHEPCIEAFKFMDCSIKYMLERFREYGIANNEIEIKIFGGADTLMSKISNSIGSQNVKTTLRIIGREKMRVVAADVGDSFGRKLVFFTHTGEVFLQRLKNHNNRNR